MKFLFHMKNLVDSSIQFSVITEDNLMQTYTLSPTQDMLAQSLMSMSNNLYVLQQIGTESVEEAVVAERFGDDLLLSFRSQEQNGPALTLERFFANNGQLHVLQQDGQFVRALSAQDNAPQGPQVFSSQPELQQDNSSVGLLHRLMAPEVVSPAAQTEATNLPVASTGPSPEQAPELHQSAALPQSAMMPTAPAPFMAPLITPALVTPPVITRALDQLGDRQGELKSGNVTDDKFAALEGTGPAGATLEIFDGAEFIGQVKVDGSGHWAFEPEQAFVEGGHVLSVRVKGSGETSEPFTLVIDSIAPKTAEIISIVDDRTTAQVIDKNGHTGDNTPVLNGKAEAFSMVAIYVGQNLLGTSFADASGNWKFSSFFIMPDGEYSITAKAIDFSGNTSLASKPYKITIDTIPPVAPIILHADDNVGPLQGQLNGGALTDDHTPTLSGKAEAGTTVFVYDNGNLIGTAVTGTNGNWSLTPATDLNDGAHHFTAVARDLAGNLSTPSEAFELTLGADRTQTPTIGAVIDDVGSVVGALNSGGVTDDTMPTLKGTATAGDTVRIYDNNVLIGETVADEQGDWSFTPAQELPEGPHVLTAQASSETGSPSEMSQPFELVVDITDPDASQLQITGVYDDEGSVTGNVLSGGRTDDHTPRVSGTGTAGDTVILYVTEPAGTREIGRAQVGLDGKWSVEVNEALRFGQNVFTAVEVDTAGNTTPHSDGYTITVSNDTVGSYDLNAAANSSRQINTTTQGEQSNPQVTRLANGNLVVVWQQSVNNAADGYDVVMQLMDSTGTKKIGQEQLINQRNVNNQNNPQVTALADGSYLVVWESYQASSLDNSGDSVFARRYNADGSPGTDEFLVNQTIVGAQHAASTLGLPDGGYIISWYSDQGGQSIMQRAYDANNRPVGGEVIVKAGGASKGYGGPEMALFEDAVHAGWYITVWNGAGNGTDVFGQLRKSDGSAASPILTLNTTRDNSQNWPDVITLKDGSFVVFWDTDDSKANGSDVRAVHYTFDPSTGQTTALGGGDFIVNQYTPGKQYKPVGVALDDGGYMLFWGSEGGDGSGSAIYGQRFDATSYKVGHEFLVNPVTQGNQGAGFYNVNLTHMLDAVLMADGNVFVTWQSDNIDGAGYGIEGVALDIDAGFYSEFIVNSRTSGNQLRSTTAELPGGGFIVVWESYQSGNGDVMAQVFDASGMPVGNEFMVNTTNAGWQGWPDITALKDGTVMITWQGNNGGANSVFTQRYSFDGDTSLLSKVGGETKVNITTADSVKGVITALDDGGYLLTWASWNGGQWDILARQYDKNGAAATSDTLLVAKTSFNGSPETWNTEAITTLADGRVVFAYLKNQTGNDIAFKVYDPVSQTFGAEVMANQTVAGNQTAPGVAMLTNGNFVVTWDSNNNNGPDQSGWGVWGRIYSPDGYSVGNEFLINTYTPGDQKNPITVARPGGGFVVLYESAADIAPGKDSLGIYAQFFDDAGHHVGQEMRIHQLMSGDQSRPDVVFLEDGRLFVTWTDAGVGDGSGQAIKGRVIDLDTTLGLGLSVDVGVTHQGLMLAVEGGEVGEVQTYGSLWMLFDDGSTSGLLLTDQSLKTVHGGSGNDVIGISDTSFTFINGGAGVDTLLLDGKNMALDLNALVERMTGIEKIDLGQGGSNSLSLNANALEGLGQTNMMLADGKNQFVIKGDASNSIQLKDIASESWTDAGQTEIKGVIYHAYVAGSTELFVEENIHVTMQ